MTEANLPDAESAEHLAAQLLARMDWRRERRAGPPPPSRTISILDRWIVDDPERAWPLFLELVRLRPDDDEVLELVWRCLRFLLSQHADAFHARVVVLVSSNALLRRIAPAAELEVEHYRPSRWTCLRWWRRTSPTCCTPRTRVSWSLSRSTGPMRRCRWSWR